LEKAITKITFLGTAACIPTAGHDTASFIINSRHLVDVGWYSAIKMLNYGFSPLDMETVFISHCHHDHYMGLPQILFYLTMQRSQRPEKPPVKIVGPEADIQRVANLAYSLLQVERFPELQFTFEVIPVSPGESLDTNELHIDTCDTIHPVQGLCYRFTDKRTQSSFVYTGDTAYHPPIADHARGATLLIHEASHGPNTSSDRYAHSGSLEAAKIAQLAGVNWLALIHCPESLAQKALDTARQIVPNTFLPEDGQTIEIP